MEVAIGLTIFLFIAAAVCFIASGIAVEDNSEMGFFIFLIVGALLAFGGVMNSRNDGAGAPMNKEESTERLIKGETYVVLWRSNDAANQFVLHANGKRYLVELPGAVPDKFIWGAGKTYIPIEDKK